MEEQLKEEVEVVVVEGGARLELLSDIIVDTFPD